MTHEQLKEEITTFVEYTIDNFKSGVPIIYRGKVYTTTQIINLEFDIRTKSTFDLDKFLAENPKT